MNKAIRPTEFFWFEKWPPPVCKILFCLAGYEYRRICGLDLLVLFLTEWHAGRSCEVATKCRLTAKILAQNYSFVSS